MKGTVDIHRQDIIHKIEKCKAVLNKHNNPLDGLEEYMLSKVKNLRLRKRDNDPRVTADIVTANTIALSVLREYIKDYKEAEETEKIFDNLMSVAFNDNAWTQSGYLLECYAEDIK